MEPFKIQDLINYLENTKEEDWLVDRVRDKDGKGCVMSHIYDFGGGDTKCPNSDQTLGSEAWDFFEEVWATTYMIYEVNDGANPRYTQPTPKKRCIAYIKDLKNGKAKTVLQLWSEYEKGELSPESPQVDGFTEPTYGL